jgi:hypothetical protein
MVIRPGLEDKVKSIIKWYGFAVGTSVFAALIKTIAGGFF